ncbi:uncharacterized protein LOC135840823 [Planococcus citri]|uniref:uncharacterized protein LOC135840823 n=1 Tax=Planococcus citri TaxID=170843 RepID=UPI0031F7BCBF
MMRHSSVLLMILIAYLAHSFGRVMIPYENNTALYYSTKENISITCIGTNDDKVTWMHDNTLEGNYTIDAQTPHRKVLEIKNATLFNAGIYYCVSTKNSNEFMRMYILPDESSIRDYNYRKFT